MNWDARAALEYHERTKHSPESVRRNTHRLDWANRPHPFKEYVGLEPLPLPRELERVLRLGAGVIRTRALPGGETYAFRTYSSAGALYPVELYLACGAIDDLDAGLYHFHAGELTLRRLREDDVRAHLADAAVAPELREARAVLILSGILWRSAWKYEARAYRHLYWDAGTMLANLLELAADDALAPRVLTGFVDDDVNHVLGVDGRREAALALMALGRAHAGPAARPLEPLALEVAPLSRRERSYPDAEALHTASALASPEEVRRYRGQPAAEESVEGAPRVAARPDELDRAIRRRGSIREFESAAVPVGLLGEVLAAGAAPAAIDVPPSCELYAIANAVDGIDPGAYRFAPPERFEPLRGGEFRLEAGFLVLEQPLGALAAVTSFLMADLGRVLGAHGNRGYRAVHLEAGIRTGRLYLAAFARGLGATASTFYDDAVSHFFRAPQLSPILAAAVGYARRG